MGVSVCRSKAVIGEENRKLPATPSHLPECDVMNKRNVCTTNQSTVESSVRTHEANVETLRSNNPRAVNVKEINDNEDDDSSSGDDIGDGSLLLLRDTETASSHQLQLSVQQYRSQTSRVRYMEEEAAHTDHINATGDEEHKKQNAEALNTLRVCTKHVSARPLKGSEDEGSNRFFLPSESNLEAAEARVGYGIPKPSARLSATKGA